MEGGEKSVVDQSPLIHNQERSHGFDEERTLGGGCCLSAEVFEEVKKQLWLAGPLVAVSLLQYCLQVISIMFVGHLGELPLSSASIATSFASVTGFSVLLGMGSALETLCGQAYGAKQYNMLGIHTQRAIFLQTQNIVFPLMVSSGMTACFHIVVCWILVFKCGLGSKGAALANNFSNWVNVFLLAIYVNFSPACTKTWTGFSKEALHDILSFVKLAIPSAIMICLEYWSFEMVVLLSGLLPNPKLQTSVLSISLNTCWTVYMISVGLGGAISTRVSNELGAGSAQGASLALRVVIIIAISEGAVLVVLTILVRHVWGKLYSSEEEVIRYVARMMPLLALSDFLDGFQCVLSGAARGCGWQNICAGINLGAYYIVAIPSAVLFAFIFHMGGMGLWLGIICGLSVQVVALVTIILCTNWDQEARRAVSRVQKTCMVAA